MVNRQKIAVAMSGGVDSSVAALILKSRGFDVVGVNLNLWSCFKASKAKTCCSPEDRRDAGKVCDALGIPFVSIDMREEFKEKIVLSFVEEYCRGRTPNPCIRCNTLIKFGALVSWIEKEMGIGLLATGHYSRIITDPARTHLLKGVDLSKDQSYFLYDIDCQTLSKIRFPLGEYVKEDVRKMAKGANLPVAEKAESQEACFIPDGDVASFIEDYYPDYARPDGNFVDTDGRVLGRHRGTHAYTIGQRRGLGMGFGQRRYVCEIRPGTNEIVLGDDGELMETGCSVEGVNLLEDVRETFEAEVKIRYKSPAVPAKITLGNGRKAAIAFKEPVRAITPGQAAVFYKGDLVLGGGWIGR